MFPFWKNLFLKHQIKTALDNDELVLFYQPQWDLKTSRIIGMEALLRRSRGGKIIPPMQFIPQWEQAGLLPLITSFLFKKALTDLKHLHNLGYTDLTVAVNISATEIDERLAAKIKDALSATNMPANALECELTETMPLSTPDKIKLFNELHDVGVILTLDDFGTGHATDDILSALKVDRIKLDKSLVWGAPNDTVTHAVQLARKLKLSVLAEGVETAEQNNWFAQNGGHFGQGFFLSPPLPLDKFIQLLRDKSI